MQAFGVKAFIRRERNEAYEEEKKEFQKKMSEYRKKHLKDWWDLQTQVENDFLDKYHQDKTEKKIRDLNRWRSAICKISMHTKRQIQDLEKKEEHLLAQMRMKDLKDTRRKMELRLKFDTMEVDSMRWPNLLDMGQRIDDNVFLPQTILNYDEYHKKLQNLAFYAEQADYEQMQKLLDKEEVIERKNVFLVPLYRDLKTIIRHMTNTEEYQILKDFTNNRNLILASFPKESEIAKKAIKELQGEYSKLLKKLKESFSDPSYKLKTLQRRLENIFQLLSTWQQYVDIVYMPEAELEIMDKLRKMDARPERDSFLFKKEKVDVKNRIEEVFGKDQKKVKKNEGEEIKEEEDYLDVEKSKGYETVNEEETSETSDDGDHSQKRQKMKDNEAEPDKSKQKKQKEKQQDEDIEGILSTQSEEEEKTIPKKEQDQQKKRNQKSDDEEQEEISAFTDKRDENSSLFDDPKKAKQIEKKYNIADTHISQFAQKLQAEFEERAYKQTNYLEEQEMQEQENQDFSNLNLFGTKIEEETQEEQDEKNGTNKQTQSALKELLEMIDEVDSGQLMDFKIQKTYVHYDPYNPDPRNEHQHLQYEDGIFLRASIVLDYYKQDLLSMKDVDLTFTEKERKQKVLQLIDYLAKIKIIDAPILMQIYNIYRQKL